MSTEKKKWVNETLNSLDGIQPVQPRNDFYGKVMRRIKSGRLIAMPETVSMSTVYKIAAGILLIVSLNAFTCIDFAKQKAYQQKLMSFAREYSLVGNTYNF